MTLIGCHESIAVSFAPVPNNHSVHRGLKTNICREMFNRSSDLNTLRILDTPEMTQSTALITGKVLKVVRLVPQCHLIPCTLWKCSKSINTGLFFIDFDVTSFKVSTKPFTFLLF